MQQRDPAFHGVLSGRVELQTIQVVPKIAGGFLDLDRGRLQQIAAIGKLGVQLREPANLGGGRPELVFQRGVGLAQELNDPSGGLLKLTKVGQTTLFPLQGLDLRRRDPKILELRDLKSQQVEPLGPFSGRRLEVRQLSTGRVPLAVVRRDLGGQVGVLAVGVQKVPLVTGTEQRLVGVLPVNIDQQVTQAAQLGTGSRPAVDIGARSAFADDQPANDALAVLIERLRGEPVAGAGTAAQVETGDDLGSLAARSDHGRVGLLAKHQA